MEKTLGELISEHIEAADRLQHDAEAMMSRSGEAANVSDVMTAVRKTEMAFRMLMQIQNRIATACAVPTRSEN